MQNLDDVLNTAGARQFYDYWNSLPKVNLVPDRKDFNPPSIHRLMPSVSILELVAPDRMIFRLLGTDLVRRMGFDATGQNYLDSFAPEARAAYVDIVYTQVNHPCGRRSVLKGREPSGILVRVEVLVLPMSNELTGHPLLVSCFADGESIGFNPGDSVIKGVEDVVWIDIGAGVPTTHLVEPEHIGPGTV